MTDRVDQLAHQHAELRVSRVHAVELFHDAFGLGVLLDLVLDKLVATRQRAAHCRIDGLLLGLRVLDQLHDDLVGDGATCLWLGGPLVFGEHELHFAVVLLQ